MENQFPQQIFYAFSLLFSCFALFVSLAAYLASRRHIENNLIFDISDRYAARLDALASAESSRDQIRQTIHMLNFLENICLLFNRKRSGSIANESTLALVTDFITMTAFQIEANGGELEFDKFLTVYGPGKDDFSELKAFAQRYRLLILRKHEKLRGSALAELSRSQSI